MMGRNEMKSAGGLEEETRSVEYGGREQRRCEGEVNGLKQ
jgi:hypothetical protein